MMKRVVLLLAFLCSVTLSWAEKDIDLEAVYRQVDEAIENSPQYVAEREAKINEQRKHFWSETDGERKLLSAQELFWLYKPYKNDSALAYAQICVNLADSLHILNVKGRFLSLMARQCSNAGMYVESKELLERIDKSWLDQQGMTDYYDAYMHVCGEIAAYTLIDDERNYYFAEQDHYRDSVLMVASKGSDEYLHLLMSNLVAKNEFQEALRVSDQWLNKTTEGTHEDAYAAYYRHIVYDKLGNGKMTRYWLAKSALDDIKCAVMDQASLTTLAQLLNYDGETERSYKYIRFTWDCNRFFNTRMRASQISPVLGVIEKNYKDTSSRIVRYLTIAAIVFCVMSVFLCFLFLKMRRQKRKLDTVRQELEESNERYAEVNHKLQRMNDKVMKYNKELFEMNHKLQEGK